MKYADKEDIELVIKILQSYKTKLAGSFVGQKTLPMINRVIFELEDLKYQ